MFTEDAARDLPLMYKTACHLAMALTDHDVIATSCVGARTFDEAKALLVGRLQKQREVDNEEGTPFTWDDEKNQVFTALERVRPSHLIAFLNTINEAAARALQERLLECVNDGDWSFGVLEATVQAHHDATAALIKQLLA